MAKSSSYISEMDTYQKKNKNPDANRGFFFAKFKIPLKIAVPPRCYAVDQFPSELQSRATARQPIAYSFGSAPFDRAIYRS